jgi:hypothetical protein
MLETYQAILRANRLEWTGEAPAGLPADQGVRVHVTLLERASVAETDRGQQMAAALEALAALGGLSGITDPAAWEREVRQDRPLPGREE